MHAKPGYRPMMKAQKLLAMFYYFLYSNKHQEPSEISFRRKPGAREGLSNKRLVYPGSLNDRLSLGQSRCHPGGECLLNAGAKGGPKLPAEGVPLRG